MGELVYLDICCFKRPFDDSSEARVRREAQAVATILASVEKGEIQLVGSPAHIVENEKNPREDRRLATRLWLEAASVQVSPSRAAGDRARRLAALGFAPMDALHLAFAEEAGATWFGTTDDRLVKRAATRAGELRVQVVRPDEIPMHPKGNL